MISPEAKMLVKQRPSPGPERFVAEIARLVKLFSDTAQNILTLVLATLDSVDKTGDVTATVRAEGFVERAVRLLKDGVRLWIQNSAPRMYIAGHKDAGGEADTPDDLTREQRASLNVQIVDLTSRLLEASQDMADDAKGRLREIARRRLQALMAGEEGIGRGGLEFRRELEDRGIRVRDRAGREQDPGSYSRMVLRTTSGTLLNTGHVETAMQLGAPGVRVSDGDYDEECREADGQAWGLSYALRNPLHHPNCRRSFSSLASTFSGPLDRE